MFFRGNETVTIVRRTENGVDDFGNPTYTTSTTTVRDCLIGFGNSDEPVDAERDAIDARITVYMPEGTVIEPGDVFNVRNTQWVKDGDPAIWQSPFASWDLPIIVQMRKRRG